MAARYHLRDLEEGTSYLHSIGSAPSQISGEVVRIGCAYQLSSTRTSFVAVQARDQAIHPYICVGLHPVFKPQRPTLGYASSTYYAGGAPMPIPFQTLKPTPSIFGSTASSTSKSFGCAPATGFGMARAKSSASSPHRPQPSAQLQTGFSPSSFVSFQPSAAQPKLPSAVKSSTATHQPTSPASFGLFDLNSAPTLPLPSFASSSQPKPPQPLMDLFALPTQALQPTLPMTAQDHLSSAQETTPWQQQQQLSNMFGDIADDGAHQHQPTSSPQQTTTEVLQALVCLQQFDGSFVANEDLCRICGLSPSVTHQLASTLGLDISIITTALAVSYFETRLATLQDDWQLVVNKGRKWLFRVLSGTPHTVGELVDRCGACL